MRHWGGSTNASCLLCTWVVLRWSDGHQEHPPPVSMLLVDTGAAEVSSSANWLIRLAISWLEGGWWVKGVKCSWKWGLERRTQSISSWDANICFTSCIACPNGSHQGIPKCELLACADWWSSHRAFPPFLITRSCGTTLCLILSAAWLSTKYSSRIDSSLYFNLNRFVCLFMPNEWIFSTYGREGLEGSWRMDGVNLIYPWRIERAIWSLRSTVEVLADRSDTKQLYWLQSRDHYSEWCGA